MRVGIEYLREWVELGPERGAPAPARAARAGGAQARDRVHARCEGRVRGRLPEYERVSRFPHVRCDLALVVGEDLTVQLILDSAAKAGGALLERARTCSTCTAEKGSKQVEKALV